MRRIEASYVDVTPGDSPQADALNLVLAVAIVAGLRKTAMATAGKLPGPAPKRKADTTVGGYL